MALLTGKNALVTGGSRGIGFGVAQVLAAEGCNLHLASRNEADLGAARDKILAAHPQVKVALHALDLGVPENTARLARECGELDILINNAGAIPQGTLTDFAADGVALELGPRGAQLHARANAFVRALEYAAGRTAVVVGKPDPTFYDTAVDALQVPADQVVMIGDDIHTDIEGAQRAGLAGREAAVAGVS